MADKLWKADERKVPLHTEGGGVCTEVVLGYTDREIVLDFEQAKQIRDELIAIIERAEKEA